MLFRGGVCVRRGCDFVLACTRAGPSSMELCSARRPETGDQTGDLYMLCPYMFRSKTRAESYVQDKL